MKTFQENGKRIAVWFCALALSIGTAQATHDAHTGGLTDEQHHAMEAFFKAFGDESDFSRYTRAQSAVQNYVRQRETEIQQQAVGTFQEMLRTGNYDLPSFGGDGAHGDAVVFEFSDYQCGFCRRMFSVLRDSHVKVQVIEFPVLGEASLRAARHALAAHKQGLYAPFHISLMGNPGGVSDETMLAAAQAAGLDIEQWRKDAESEEVTQALARNRELAQVLRVRGTPFMVINGTAVPGAVDAARFNQLIAPQEAQQ